MADLESMFASMSVAELARIAGSTVEQIIVASMGSSSGRRAATNGASTTVRQPARAGKVTRGGVSPDALLQIVAGAGGPIDINGIRAKIGGSAAQVRAGLQKLAAAKRVKITGKKRGTRYTAA